jgi:hypothetical protein
VPIEGYLDAVDPMQIRGWAHDPARPDEVVTVRIMLDNQLIAEGPAKLFRDDLASKNVGDGDCAFIFNLEKKLTEGDIGKISAFARAADGTQVPLPQAETRNTIELSTAASHRQIEFLEPCSDDSQQPVFILGAARSGTSAIAHALLKLGIFEGHKEGHLLDLLAHFSVALRKFYDLKHDEITDGRDTAITRVPIEFVRDGLDHIFFSVTRELFPTSRWVDKTPNSDMVHLAPRFKKLWPRSRFIFMRRRFLENSVSRSRKFPNHTFERSAKEWSDTMEAWLQVRPLLEGSAVEIDQMFLTEKPESVGKQLVRFLSLTETEGNRLSQALRYDLPERTSVTRQNACELSTMGWDNAENTQYAQYCEKLMSIYGYGIDASYYLPGFENQGFVYV